MATQDEKSTVEALLTAIKLVNEQAAKLSTSTTPHTADAVQRLREASRLLQVVLLDYR
jgi:hypothetical protein